jgi:phosphonate dehydrogenase
VSERTRPLVYYTHWCPPEGPALLAERCTVVTQSPGGPASRARILAEAYEASALCYFVPDLIDADLIAALPKLRVLAGFGKGFDNVDLAAARACGIWVTNVPFGLTEATADLAWTLMMTLARRVLEADALVRSGAYGWHESRLLGRGVHGTTLGLWGFGAIGRALARRAAGFGMEVIYHDSAPPSEGDEASPAARFVAPEALLRQSDHLVLCLPLTDRTRRLVGEAELAAMKPTAALINTARGSIVDEDAVAAALAAGRLAGYAADVLAVEDQQYPDRPSGVPRALLAQRERTVFTPHLGTAVLADRVALARWQAEDVLEALSGRRPRGAVDGLP